MKRRHRILFLTESLGTGGQERSLTTLLRHIDTTHYDVTVLSIAGGGQFETEVKAMTNIRYRVLLRYNDFVNRLISKAIYSILPPWVVARILVRGQYDTVVAFCEGQLTRWIAALPRKKKPFTQAWVHTDLIDNDWPVTERVFKNADAEALSYKRFDSVIGISETVRGGLRQKFELPKVECVHNFIDLNAVCKGYHEALPSTVQRLTTAFNLISIGRHTRVKGYDLLLKAVASLPDIGLYLVGEGIDTTPLKALASKLGMSDRVVFLGQQNNPYPYLQLAHTYVCPSRHEGFNIAIIEAMASGLPVIATDCAGPREILGSDSQYGLLCKPTDLAGAIQQFHHNCDLRQHYVQMSKTRAADFNINKQLQAFYASIQRRCSTESSKNCEN